MNFPTLCHRIDGFDEGSSWGKRFFRLRLSRQIDFERRGMGSWMMSNLRSHSCTTRLKCILGKLAKLPSISMSQRGMEIDKFCLFVSFITQKSYFAAPLSSKLTLALRFSRAFGELIQCWNWISWASRSNFPQTSWISDYLDSLRKLLIKDIHNISDHHHHPLPLDTTRARFPILNAILSSEMIFKLRFCDHTVKKIWFSHSNFSSFIFHRCLDKMFALPRARFKNP